MRWRILALLFLARVGLGLQFQTLPSVGDDLSVAYGLDQVEVGALIGLFMAPGLFLALPAGLAGSRLADRALAAFGLAALAAGGLVSAMAGDAWTIGLGRTVAGGGFLVTSLYFTKMLADWFSGREIATAMSVLVMSWPFGIAMGQIGHEWLAQTIGWRAAFHAASAYCAIAAVGVLAFYRSAPATAPATPGVSAIALTKTEWRLIAIAGLAWGVFNAGYIGYLTYGPQMLEAQGQSALEAAAVISIGSWLMILSGAACGWIVDRTGRRDLVLAVCMAVAVVALMLLTVDGAGPAASILFGLLGMAPAGVIIAYSGEAVRPERRAFGMGVFLTVYYAIMSLGPPVAGWLVDRSGSAFAAIVFAAALLLSVLPATLAFRSIKRRASAAVGPAASAQAESGAP